MSSRRTQLRWAGPALLGCLVVITAVPGRAGNRNAAAWAGVLERFVTPDARVRYAALQKEPAELHRFLLHLGSVDPHELAARSRNERIAFWINAYNAITVAAVVEVYPIHRRGLAGYRYPANSIRQIDGVWTRARWTVAGRTVSLDQIEDEILRKGFREPLVHLALVCASVGCPPLRREPYSGDTLEAQLRDQARRYLASPSGLRLEDGGRTVRVSRVFRWFRGDFGGRDGLRSFLERDAPAEAAAALARGARIRYLTYDWALNDIR